MNEAEEALLVSVEKLHAFGVFVNAYKAAVEAMERDLSRVDVPLTEFQVLYKLARAEDNRMRFRDLASSLMVSESRVSRLMQGMVEKGYVRKESNAKDRRAIYAILTPEGSRVYDQTFPHFAATLERNFSSKLADDRVKDFMEVLVGLIEGVQISGNPNGDSSGAASSIGPWFRTATRLPVRIVAKLQVIEGEDGMRGSEGETWTLEIGDSQGFIVRH